MPRITGFHPVTVDSHRVHDEVECGHRTFSAGGKRYVQLDTYGRFGRAQPGKVSQSVQLDEAAAHQLLHILREAFPAL